MNTMAAYKTLLWAKARKLKAHEAQVAQAQQRCREALETQAQANTEAQRQALLEEQGLETLTRTVAGESFRPEHLLVLRSLQEALQASANAARAAARNAQEAQLKSVALLQAAQARLQRAHSQIGTLELRRDELRGQLAQADDDQQDEESEEAAVARRVQATRQTMQPTQGMA
jgi:Bacterial type III secretion protein (HrpB7)